MPRRLSLLLCIALLVIGLPVSAGAQTGKPSSGALPIPETEVNEGLPPGLIQYSDIAARLNEIVAESDRVTAEVVGQSAEGRDLYLVTVSDPKADKGRTKALRQMMLRDPAQAQEMAAQFKDFRVPFFINASIHGNEYEGVDAALAVIERLAFSNDAETQAILDNVILLVNVVQNPDGRVNNTRANGNGFDVNRDFITNSQPESRIVRDLLVEWNPMVLLDLHGYVNPMLIEPTTPPHNPNYEYDLYIRWALSQAEAMEDGLLAAYDALRNDPEFEDDWERYVAGPLRADQATIPFRDWEVGDWDDWPPIFTPMYAMYHGAYGHTLEVPLNPRSSRLSPEAKAARARVNTEAHTATSWSALTFAAENKAEMVDDQLEVFARGEAGVAPVPVEPGFVPGFGPEDQYPADYPEAYVIPAGDAQESLLAAERLVNFLIAHDVEVQATKKAFTLDGVTYPAGSWIVSMQQPKRGLANTILEIGYDISLKTPQMYDISGWSHAALWGATVVRAETPVDVLSRQISAADVAGALPSGSAAAYRYELDSKDAIKATNALLEAGVPLQRGDDGTIVVSGTARTLLEEWAERGLTFTALADVPTGLETVDQVRIAASVNSGEEFVLDELRFDADDISESALNDGSADISDYDVLMVSGGFDYDDLNDAARSALSTWLADGGGVVTISSSGASFNNDADLLDVSFQEGPNCAVANGVVTVDNGAESPVTAGFPTEDTAFVYDPVWFPEVADDVSVDQSYDTEDVLLAGHWLGDYEQWVGDDTAGPNCRFARDNSGQDDAAGHAAVVSGTDETGARVVLFGTEPLFRAHPEKLFGQVANALYWVSAE